MGDHISTLLYLVEIGSAYHIPQNIQNVNSVFNNNFIIFYQISQSASETFLQCLLINIVNHLSSELKMISANIFGLFAFKRLE